MTHILPKVIAQKARSLFNLCFFSPAHRIEDSKISSESCDRTNRLKWIWEPRGHPELVLTPSPFKRKSAKAHVIQKEQELRSLALWREVWGNHISGDVSPSNSPGCNNKPNPILSSFSNQRSVFSDLIVAAHVRTLRYWSTSIRKCGVEVLLKTKIIKLKKKAEKSQWHLCFFQCSLNHYFF